MISPIPMGAFKFMGGAQSEKNSGGGSGGRSPGIPEFPNCDAADKSDVDCPRTPPGNSISPPLSEEPHAAEVGASFKTAGTAVGHAALLRARLAKILLQVRKLENSDRLHLLARMGSAIRTSSLEIPAKAEKSAEIERTRAHQSELAQRRGLAAVVAQFQIAADQRRIVALDQAIGRAYLELVDRPENLPVAVEEVHAQIRQLEGQIAVLRSDARAIEAELASEAAGQKTRAALSALSDRVGTGTRKMTQVPKQEQAIRAGETLCRECGGAFPVGPAACPNCGFPADLPPPLSGEVPPLQPLRAVDAGPLVTTDATLFRESVSEKVISPAEVLENNVPAEPDTSDPADENQKSPGLNLLMFGAGWAFIIRSAQNGWLSQILPEGVRQIVIATWPVLFCAIVLALPLLLIQMFQMLAAAKKKRKKPPPKVLM